MRGITAEEVADYRKQHGCGMMEARRMVEKKHVDEHIEQLESLVRDLYECNLACTCDECVRRNEEEWHDNYNAQKRLTP